MIDILIPKYTRQVLILALIAYLLPSLSAAIVYEHHLQPMVGMLGSILLFPVTFIMIYIVLGVQVINPFCSEKILGYFCVFFIYFAGASCLLFGLTYPILLFFSAVDPADMTINSVPAGFGAAFGAYIIRKKYAASTISKEILANDESFLSQIKNWLIINKLKLISVTALIIIFVVAINLSLKNSTAYNLSLTTAKNNNEVSNVLGEPITPTFWVTGEINTTNQNGSAILNYKIIGSKSMGELYTEAEKTDGVWILKTLTLQPEQGPKIELIHKAND